MGIVCDWNKSRRNESMKPAVKAYITTREAKRIEYQAVIARLNRIINDLQKQKKVLESSIRQLEE